MEALEARRSLRSETRRDRSSRSRRQSRWFLFFVSPFIFGLVCLTIFPAIFGFYVSLTDYDGLYWPDADFVGFANYARMLDDPDVSFAAGQTLRWVSINVPLWVITSFAVALLLNRKIWGARFFRTAFYLPTVVPIVATVTVWKLFLDKNAGLLNAFLSVFQPGTAIPFLSRYALQSIATAAVWGGLGWGMVVFLAGLQDIPSELVEAAKIDGANGWQLFRAVTLPLMTPVLFFQILTSLINSFQQLAYPLLMGWATYPPNIPRPIYFFMVHTWQEIYGGQFGYGAALLWVLFLVVALVAVLVFWSERFWVFKRSEG